MPPKRQPSKRSLVNKATASSNAAQDAAKEGGDEAKQEANVELTTSDAQPFPAALTAQPATNTPAETISTNDTAPSASPQPTQAARGGRPTAKPRNVQRKSLAQRNELAKAEADKKAAVEAKAAEELAKLKSRPQESDARATNKFFYSIPSEAGTSYRIGRDRGRGRGRGTGRGGYMSNTVASGPFSAGQVSKEPKPRWGKTTSTPRATTSTGSGGGRGRGGGAKAATTSNKTASKAITEGGRSVQRESKASTRTSAAGGIEDVHMEISRDVGLISSDESDQEDGEGIRRMNVEDFGVVIDLTADDAEFDPFAPIRVRRVTHEQRSLGLNADGATNQEGSITVDANDTTNTTASEKKKGKQRMQDKEPIDEKPSHPLVWSDSDVEEEIPIKPDPEGEQAEVTQDPSTAIVSDDHPREPPSSPESKRKAKERIKAGTVERPSYQTREENEEWDRIQDDLEVMRAELGEPALQDQDGDTTMTIDAAAADKRAEKVYLFQFPPILPNLASIAVKPDPDAAEATAAQANDTEPMQVDGEDTKPIILLDEDNAAKDSDINRPTKLPSGAVGKMKVHASGRVTLDWGGTSLCVGMGTAASFLQDIIVAQVPESKEGDEMVQTGHAANMGQVKGKFVVTPDWDAILN